MNHLRETRINYVDNLEEPKKGRARNELVERAHLLDVVDGEQTVLELGAPHFGLDECAQHAHVQRSQEGHVGVRVGVDEADVGHQV